MRAIDISIDDRAVVDNDGSIWVYFGDEDAWRYLTEDGLGYDSRTDLEESFEPYVVLDKAAATVAINAAISHANSR